jgi:hypothetical protein
VISKTRRPPIRPFMRCHLVQSEACRAAIVLCTGMRVKGGRPRVLPE